MKRILLGAIVAGTAVAVATWAQTPGPGLFSKKYQFHKGVTIDVGETGPGGLRLDSVRFDLPSASGDRLLRTAGVVTARVGVSNTSPDPQTVGIAIALFDDEGRLLAVAGGGNKLTPVKAGRQKTFGLVFDGVNAEAHKATKFHISLEAKP